MEGRSKEEGGGEAWRHATAVRDSMSGGGGRSLEEKRKKVDDELEGKEAEFEGHFPKL